MEDQNYIELRGICKSFGEVIANKNIHLSVKKGEIHALLGENGSGKSTLVNMLSGIYAPDAGEIYIDGKQVMFQSPKDAIVAGIGMIHQHFKLVEKFTAAENIVAGSKVGLFIRKNQRMEKINAVAERFGLTGNLAVNPNQKVYDMSVAEKQTVEILKVLYRGANVLILDEPTAVLTPQETRVLFDILRKMKEQGCSIIIITHKLNEVMEISDRVTVLRKGESIETVNTIETSPAELTEMMVGRPVSLAINRIESHPSEEPMLTLRDVVINGDSGRPVLDHISFDVYGGEIVGVAGIAGSGQKELCELIAGMQKANEGSVKFKGENILGLSPRDIINKGISMSFVPEDRLGMGLVAGCDVVDNVMLKTYNSAKGLFVDRAEGKKKAERIIERFDISTPSSAHIVKKLSGGNIQKVLLGREIDLEPNLLITAYPVRGLDIGASYNIYDILNEQKDKGVGVLYIGEDLDVLLELCDRIIVLHAGRIMDVLRAEHASKDQIGLLMLGHSEEVEAE